MMSSQEIFDKKKALRAAALKKAALLPPENKSIARAVLSLPAWSKANTVFCFVSYGCEPDTAPLIQAALKSGKRLCVPLCQNNGLMKAVQIKSTNDLKKGMYGILEPPGQNAEILPGELDFVIVPCLAADKNKNRLGKGGGYYDRFLAQCAPECTKLLLCRKELMIDAVPIEAHDIKADILICN